MSDFLVIAEPTELEPLRDPYEYDYLDSIDWCAHFTDRADRSCMHCFGLGSEYLDKCREPGSDCHMTWHSGTGRCLRCTDEWANILKLQGLEETEYSRKEREKILAKRQKANE